MTRGGSVEEHNEVPGGVVEWLMAPVLKTGRPKGLVGSNPTPSAIYFVIKKARFSNTSRLVHRRFERRSTGGARSAKVRSEALKLEPERSVDNPTPSAFSFRFATHSTPPWSAQGRFSDL